MKTRNEAGFTWVEALVAVLVVLVLFCLMFRPSSREEQFARGTMALALSHMKQLYEATDQMARDGVLRKDSMLGWPGDMGGSFSNWTTLLVQGGYLTRSEVLDDLSLRHAASLETNNNRILVYAVAKADPTNAVFMTTANFTNTATGGVLDRSMKPFESYGFVVFHRGGDGMVLQARQASEKNLIGTYVPLCQ